VDVRELGIDMLSGSAHKFYGPKGVGILYARIGTRFTPYSHGGAHERNKRAGTENVPGIVGLARALELDVEEMESNTAHINMLADRLYEGLMSRIPDISFNGDPDRRIKATLNFTFAGCEGEATILSLDMKGIAVSSGSACTAGSIEPSHVLRAMGVPPELAQTAIRFSLGKGNSVEDIDYCLEVLPEVVKRLRQMSPIYAQAR
jgi:cysteine desulfurase